MGIGFGVIALTHLHRAIRPESIEGPVVTFAALRLFGAFVVLLGMAQLLRRAIDKVLTQNSRQDEEPPGCPTHRGARQADDRTGARAA